MHLVLLYYRQMEYNLIFYQIFLQFGLFKMGKQKPGTDTCKYNQSNFSPGIPHNSNYGDIDRYDHTY